MSQRQSDPQHSAGPAPQAEAVAETAQPSESDGPLSHAPSGKALQELPSQTQFWQGKRLQMLGWRVLAACFMALGAAGVVLPVLPHVPFFLGALWAAGKGWPELERWLLRHPTLGPQLRNWKEHRAISLPVKWVTTVMMAGSAIGMQVFGDLPLWLRIAAPCCMLLGGIFMWTRPSA